MDQMFSMGNNCRPVVAGGFCHPEGYRWTGWQHLFDSGGCGGCRDRRQERTGGLGL